MKSYQVLYIAKPNPSCSIEQLTHIGYYESLDKSPVVITIQEAIARINLNEYEFFVHSSQQSCYLTVAGTANGDQYLKTSSDNTHTDNLLQLNELFETPQINEYAYVTQAHTEEPHTIDFSDLLPSSSFKDLRVLRFLSNKKLVDLKTISVICLFLLLLK